MREIFVTPEEAEFGSLRAMANISVAFIDVVGFTELGERVDAGELRSIAARLADAADDVIDLPVRFVKTVGDAILLMSRETPALLEALIKFQATATDHHNIPATHVGVARGWANVGGADVYGAPVNRASRLTDLAPSGKIWAAASVVDDSTGMAWVARGEWAIKGCSEPIAVFELQARD
jgi:adenylate cyclase